MTSKATDFRNSRDSGLRELFLDELKDIYWAEKALTKALPKMAKKATSEELVAALEDHFVATQTHVERLEKVFDTIGEKVSSKKCKAMEGLIEEAEEIMDETEEGIVRDAAIISAAQKVEHYEIASYGTLVSFANTIGESDAAGILEKNLDDEKEADRMLTEIATSFVNADAANAEEEEEEQE